MSVRLRDRVEAEAQRLLRDRTERLRQDLEEALRLLGAPMQFPLSPGEGGAAEGSGVLQSVHDAVETLGRGGSQREILVSLLDAAAAFYPRAAIFVLKGNAFSGWAGLGFLGEGGFKSEDLPRVTIPPTGDHLLAQAIKRKTLAHAGKEGPGAEIVRGLGGVVPGESSAIPLFLRGRPVAVLYGDSGSNGAASGHGLPLQIVARIAGLAMERIAPAAAVRATPAGPGASAPAATPSVGEAPRTGGASPPEEAEMQALLGDLARQPRREADDGGLSEEERRRHADIRRFANLLISELLLYNEAAVIQGRKHGDLRQRLKKEIDRSRQAYDARAAGMKPLGKDYFEEELVRQLALGDNRLLRN